MRARPRLKAYKKSKQARCSKCGRPINLHQKRCKVCHLALAH